jgi:hypothetical protein
MVLLGIDVFILVGELLLDVQFYCNPDQCHGECVESPHWVEKLHHALFVMSMCILAVFALELIVLFFAIGLRAFCTNFLYVLDFSIVSVAIILEIISRARAEEPKSTDGWLFNDLPTLLLVSRVWRFIRVGHGVFDVTEKHDEEKLEALEKEIRHLKTELQAFRSPTEKIV